MVAAALAATDDRYNSELPGQPSIPDPAQLMVDWGADPELAGQTWDDYDWGPAQKHHMVRAVEAARDWQGTNQWLLLLHGGIGKDGDAWSFGGKTHIARLTLGRWAMRIVTAARYNAAGNVTCRDGFEFALVIRQPKAGMWLDWGMYSNRITRNPDESVYAEETNARLCGLLVLDDIGREKYSEARTDALLRILDHRCQCLRPTVITSNLSPNGLVEFYKSVQLGNRLAHRALHVFLRLPPYRRGK